MSDKCYHSPIFKSREAYQNRIYYSSQICSKSDYYNTRYWDTEKELDTLYEKAVKSHYKGNLTKLQSRIVRLEEKLESYDEMRVFELYDKYEHLLGV